MVRCYLIGYTKRHTMRLRFDQKPVGCQRRSIHLRTASTRRHVHACTQGSMDAGKYGPVHPCTYECMHGVIACTALWSVSIISIFEFSI